MQKTEKASRKTLRTIALGVGAASFLTVPLASEVRLKQATQPLTDAWQHLPIEPRRSTLLGISFRSPQVAVLGLDARTTLQTLLTYPFQLIRLGAYWNRIEPEPGIFYPDELDWQDSCLPEHVIDNYNTCMRWSRQDASLYAYLFWGAGDWMLRMQ